MQIRLDFLKMKLDLFFDGIRMNISVKKDGEGYLAEVIGKENCYAFGYTEQEALAELQKVIEMFQDYYQEELKQQKVISQLLFLKQQEYAL